MRSMLTPRAAYAESILPLHLEATVRLWGRLMVATAYVGAATTSIHANGIVRIIGNGYMAVTTDLYSLILAYAPNVMM